MAGPNGSEIKVGWSPLAGFSFLSDAPAQEDRIKFIVAVVGDWLAARGNLTAGGPDLPLVPDIPITRRAATKKKRVGFIETVEGEGFPARGNPPAGGSNFPLLFAI